MSIINNGTVLFISPSCFCSLVCAGLLLLFSIIHTQCMCLPSALLSLLVSHLHLCFFLITLAPFQKQRESSGGRVICGECHSSPGTSYYPCPNKLLDQLVDRYRSIHTPIQAVSAALKSVTDEIEARKTEKTPLAQVCVCVEIQRGVHCFQGFVLLWCWSSALSVSDQLANRNTNTHLLYLSPMSIRIACMGV